MQWFHNMKVGVRMGLGFALVLIMTASMAVVGMTRLSGIKKDFNTVVRSNNVKIAMATGMRGQLNMVARAARDIILQSDAAFQQQQKEKLAECRKNYDDMSAKLESLIVTDKAKQLMAEINVSKEAVRQLNNKAIELALAGKRDEAAQFLLNDVQEPQEKWFSAIQAMVDLQEAQNKQLVEATERSYNSAFLLMLVMSVASVVLGVAFGVLVTRSVTRPLAEGVAVANAIADGDLRVSVEVRSQDETGQLMVALQHMVKNLRAMIARTADISGGIASASHQLHATAEQIATGAEEVANQTNTVATASEEMSHTSSDIARNCTMAAAASRQTTESATAGAGIVQETIGGMSLIAERVRSTSKTVEALGSRSDQIGQIVGTIEDIADQTNLLALNAAIEAARAGEQGRGFAVVADEVRALAERTTRATREIGDMIKAIQKETQEAVKAMDEGVHEVEKGAETSQRSGQALEEILGRIDEVSMQISQIATAAEQQTATTGEVTMNIQQITEVVHQSARGAEETASAASQLAKQAQELQTLVGTFRL